MYFAELSEFGESHQNPKAAWLPGVLPIWVLNAFPVMVIQSAFPLLPLCRYLLPLSTLNKCQTRDSNQNFLFITTSRMSLIWGFSLVLILLSDFVITSNHRQTCVNGVALVSRF